MIIDLFIANITLYEYMARVGAIHVESVSYIFKCRATHDNVTAKTLPVSLFLLIASLESSMAVDANGQSPALSWKIEFLTIMSAAASA